MPPWPIMAMSATSGGWHRACSIERTIRACATAAGSQPRTLSWVSEERIGGRLEFLFDKETRRRAVILGKLRDDPVALMSKSFSENLRMRIYIIGSDGIALCREAPAALHDGEIVVASKEELHAAPLSGKRLLALWNALPGVEKRRKLGDREALIDQLWSAIERLPDPEPRADRSARRSRTW